LERETGEPDSAIERALRVGSMPPELRPYYAWKNSRIQEFDKAAIGWRILGFSNSWVLDFLSSWVLSFLTLECSGEIADAIGLCLELPAANDRRRASLQEGTA